MTAPQQPEPGKHCALQEGICRCYHTLHRKEYQKSMPCPEKGCEHDTRQRNVPEGERMYAITEKHIETIHHLMTIPDHAWDDADYMMRDEVFEEIRSRPLSCMERNGAQGQRKEIDDVICINEISLALKRFRDGKLQEMVAVKKIWSLFEEMQAQPQARIAELDQLFRDCFALLSTVEKVNQDEWMDYFETKKCEFEMRYDELRTTPASPGKASGDVLAELETTRNLLYEFCEWFCHHDVDCSETPCNVTVSLLHERLEGLKKSILSNPELLKKWNEKRAEQKALLEESK